MNIKRSSQFLLDKEKDKPDAKLRYRIKWNGNIVAFNVGYRIEIDRWSKETQRCVNNTTHGKKKIAARIINNEIQWFERTAEEIFLSFEAMNHVPTADEFRFEFNKRNGKIEEQPEKRDFFKTLDEFVREVGFTNQWSSGIYKRFNVLKNHLMDFSEDVSFDDFDLNGLNNFVAFLRDQKELRNVTTEKIISLLKWFFRWADAKGYMNEKAFLKFSPKFKTSEKKVIFLEWDELMKVYNFAFPEDLNKLEKVRDVFCFCCFTGLRYSDVANLKRSDIFEDYISITTLKTADSLRIELNDYSREILKKYKNESFSNNLALPIISNQKMNDMIKQIGEICEIDKSVTITYYKGSERFDETYPKYALLSSHAGRRTFICNALMLGISPQVVMKWTGHNDYKAMKPYIDITDRAKAEAMSLFNKKKEIS